MVPGAPGVQLDRTILNRIRETFEAVSVSDEDTLKTMAAFKVSKYTVQDPQLCRMVSKSFSAVAIEK